MQLDHAETFAALRNPARQASASARGRLRRYWDRIIGRITRYCALRRPLALDEHMLRDIGLTRANAPRWTESQDYSWKYAAGWSLYMGPVTGPMRAPVTSAEGRAIDVSE